MAENEEDKRGAESKEASVMDPDRLMLVIGILVAVCFIVWATTKLWYGG